MNSLAEQLHATVGAGHNAHEVAARPDRPVDGARVNVQGLFHFGHEIERFAPRQVHLVDQGQDRDPTHAAHGEQFACLGFHPFGCIDDHDGAVGGRQGAISIFGEILMAWRVEQINHGVFVGKLHGRRRDGNAALLFHSHPIRCRRLAALASAHHARGSDQAGVQEKLFGQRRFPGIRMADDGKGPPPRSGGDKFV